MRKKLLALLMCATMVLGTAATAFAADVTPTDVTNATTIINQFKGDQGAVEYEYDAKKSPITFTTTYATKDDATKIIYTYAFDESGNAVKSNSTGKNAYTKISGIEAEIESTNQAFHAIALPSVDANGERIDNPSTNLESLDGSVLKGESGVLYYVTASTQPAGHELGDSEFVVAADTEALSVKDIPLVDGTLKLTGESMVLTLTAFTASETGDVIKGSALDKYGVDPDGYISKVDSSVATLKYSDKVADGYWVNLSLASDAKYDIAQALANNEISTSAVAVQIDFYNLKSADDIEYIDDNTKVIATQKGMKRLNNVDFEKSAIDVTFKTDWLSRSNAKNANTVYILNTEASNDYADYFYNFGKVLKVSDLTDQSFTTQYVASGVYIFDTVEDASQNDGVSSENTTTASSTTAATSPKTGDVAPIAALAVVMMGACGAMVVASKKRA
jgi:hypothetical protein